MQYHDLDVTLANGGLHYQRVARCGTRHGERQDEVPLDLEPLARALETLEAYAGARLDEQAQRDLGMLLYDGLFGRGSVGAQLERCIGGAQMEENGGVRVRLDLDGAPQLARIPWEFLYFPSDERFLAPSLQSPLIRYLRSGAANPGLEVRLPVRVLAVLPESAARGEAPLDLAAEKALLQRALAPLAAAGTADLRFLDREATPDRLRSALSGGVPELGEEPFQVVCFAGHGEAHAGGARLFLDGEGGEPVPVEDRWLAELFDPARGVKLVVLNACQGATVTGLQPFAGLAPRLVKQGVPAVVAMQFPVYDDEALCFAETFYRALFRGPSRGRVEVATSEARRALKQDFPDSRAWGAPVLYMRAGGYLFTPTTGRTARDVPLGRDEADAWREAVREHERTIGQLSQASPDERTVALLRRERRELSRALRLLRLRGLVAGAVLAVAGALTALPAL
ncbi:MAG TPA: CHAT domain-containing protein, partial [Longimicrobiaceae bacterium]|nr:CHAT domain-containing protein [Longimicrobiaceae bacterium]